jgi:hypothetical protein
MRYLFFLLLLGCSGTAGAQSTAIVLAKNATRPDLRAAEILQKYLVRMTKAEVPLLQTDRNPSRKLLIYVGLHPQLAKTGFEPPATIPEDAFFRGGDGKVYVVTGGGQMGSEYGVYDLLERLGCRKFSPRDSLIPERPIVQLPVVKARLETPAFPYRELWYEPAFDDSWARWHRLRRPADKQNDWGLFVHTFNTLCPADRYFKDHPEYFTWNGALRSSGQLCLSNDTVRQIVIASLREKISAKPDAQYWSVSQNDNYDYCKCPRCAASDKRFGSPAGTLLAFVNGVAASFPDKTISTLAYQYTRQAPKGIRPAKNVSICLCSIECNRGNPISTGCPDFARDVQEWSQLTKNLMIWDYVVQFRSYACPFPNWPTLQPNLRLFRQNGVRMLFEQGSGHDRSEFSDMRAYLLAKLMWNPDARVDSILADFGAGYYADAYPRIRGYVDTMIANLKRGDQYLWIYGTPQSYQNSFGTLALLKNYRQVGQAALTSVGGDTVLQRRVSAAFLPVRYALMELIKTDDGLWVKEPSGKMHPDWSVVPRPEKFVDDCSAAGIRHLNENGQTPAQYIASMSDYFRHGRVCHLAACGSQKSTLTLAEPASPNYQQGNGQTLIDTRTGDTDYHYNWLGFEGKDMVATIELPEVKDITGLRTHFLQDQQSWVFFPQQVVFEVSENGQEYKKVFEAFMEIAADGEKRVQNFETSSLPKGTKARYVRVTAVNQKTCPAWHICNGSPCWIFADEIEVF